MNSLNMFPNFKATVRDEEEREGQKYISVSYIAA